MRLRFRLEETPCHGSTVVESGRLLSVVSGHGADTECCQPRPSGPPPATQRRTCSVVIRGKPARLRPRCPRERRPPSALGELSWIALPGGARFDNVRDASRCRKVVPAHCQTRHPEGRVLFGSGRCFDRGSGELVTVVEGSGGRKRSIRKRSITGTGSGMDADEGLGEGIALRCHLCPSV